MNYSNKRDIIEEQRYLIGIEPVVDMKNFVLLLLADLARKTKIHDFQNNGVFLARKCKILWLKGGFSKRKRLILELKGGFLKRKCMILKVMGYFSSENG